MIRVYDAGIRNGALLSDSGGEIDETIVTIQTRLGGGGNKCKACTKEELSFDLDYLWS